MSKKVTILRGIPGSGKSTLVKEIVASHTDDFMDMIEVVSADYFFIGGDGKYNFDPTKLDKAHSECFRSYILALMTKHYSHIIVDNTNIHEFELAPYVLGATAFADEYKIVTLRCPLYLAAERNIHNVPKGTLEKMYFNLEHVRLPPFWNESYRIVRK